MNVVRLSRRLSYLLRHDPASAGLVLDAAGWVPVPDVLRALGVDRVTLDAVVAGNDKQRFAVAVGPDGVDVIRASQGHSVAVELGLPVAEPPPLLYHGTSESALASIRRTGLHKAGRHHVHLSADVATAARVGGRRGPAVVVLVVEAAAMAAAGHVFHRSANGVWLTDAVPPGYLRDEPART